MKALSIIAIIFMPLILVAQTGSEDAFKVCERVFTEVETLPDFKNGKAAFEDSLAQYLKKKNAFPKKGKVTFSFIVTREEKVLDIKKEEGEIRFEAVVKEALTSIPDLWHPAIQNTYIVCAYVRLSLEFSENKLEAKILPYKQTYNPQLIPGF